jgi:hypothetical protein
MKYLLFFVILLVLGCNQTKEPKTDFNNVLVGKTLKNFISQGYEQKYYVEGFIDEDNILDAVLVSDEMVVENEIDLPIRKLSILRGLGNKRFEIIVESSKALFCKTCGGILGDPLNEPRIEKNKISFNHLGGSRERWIRDLTFSFDSKTKNIYLIEDKYDSYDTMAPEENQRTVKTSKYDLGELEINDFDINS